MIWITRDLSNGDGADGRPWPTYVWAYKRREQARHRKRIHKQQDYSRLGPVEKWHEDMLVHNYVYVTRSDIADGTYWRRRQP